MIPIRIEGKNILYQDDIQGCQLQFWDRRESEAATIISNELKNGDYDLPALNKNDVIIDIGGHIGLVTSFYAKKYPGVNIFTFEPFPQNWQNLNRNFEVNQINNYDKVRSYNLAITTDGRPFEMMQIPNNTGSATGCIDDKNHWNDVPGYSLHTTQSISVNTLWNQIIKHHIPDLENPSIKKCLKIDCEGAEHEIIREMDKLGILKHFAYIVGELHENQHLRNKGFNIIKTKQILDNRGILYKMTELYKMIDC